MIIGQVLEWVNRRRSDQRKRYRGVAAARNRRVLLEVLESRSLLATLINTGTASDIVYSMADPADTVFLEDDGTSGNGLLQLRSSSGAFDTTVFANPTGSLT